MQAFLFFYRIKKKGRVKAMLWKRQEKRIIELNPSEVRLLLRALMNFRNKVMNAGKPTEDINELILMITK